MLTTNRQLQSMESQLKVMDSGIKLQIQPLPVTSIKKSYLEKIRPYLSPETDFSKIEILTRLHFKIHLKNVGTGAALNIFVFPSIEVKGKSTKEFLLPSLRPEQIHLVSENETEAGSFMLLDKDFELFRGLNSMDRVTLKLEIYYKNIFGSGFVEKADYMLFLDPEQKSTIDNWDNFINNKDNELEDDIKRFESLKPSLPDEAKKEYNKIKGKLREKFADDLPLECRNRANSFSVEIIDFEKSIKKAKEQHELKVKESFPDMPI